MARGDVIIMDRIFLQMQRYISILLLHEVKRKKTFDSIIVYAMYSGKWVMPFTWTSLEKQVINVKNIVYLFWKSSLNRIKKSSILENFLQFTIYSIGTIT